MATPPYKGAATSAAAPSGMLGEITSWFSVQTPQYATAPAATPAVTSPVSVPCVEPDRITLVIPRELIESQS